jgi:hypothetical protein
LSFLHSIFFCLAQYHFAEPNQHVLIFLCPILYWWVGHTMSTSGAERSPLFRHPPQKRSNNYQSVTVLKELESKKSLCAEVWPHARLIWRFYEIQVGAFHFSRCQWDRIKIERKLPQTLDIVACTFGFAHLDFLLRTCVSSR